MLCAGRQREYNCQHPCCVTTHRVVVAYNASSSQYQPKTSSPLSPSPPPPPLPKGGLPPAHPARPVHPGSEREARGGRVGGGRPRAAAGGQGEGVHA